MVSFVFHGGAMAGMHQHGPAAVSDCGSRTAKSHAHSAGSHHGLDHVHDAGDVHAHGDHHDGGDHKGASAEPCCGSMCFIAISARAPDTSWAPVAAPVELMPEVPGRPDNRPDGLKRPPRTPDIA
jgi:hypothetical protein